MDFLKEYLLTRKRTEEICFHLSAEDSVVQPIEDVSPPKWHLGHTSWFFENFILKSHVKNYSLFHEKFDYLFNSYYISQGDKISRNRRGLITKPELSTIWEYRKHTDNHIKKLIEQNPDSYLLELIELGIQHEKQHQELLLTDIKFIFWSIPLLPSYPLDINEHITLKDPEEFITMKAGMYDIGHVDKGFHFDNETRRHKVYLNEYSLSNNLVSNEEYIEFIADGGYQNYAYWLAEGWDRIQNYQIKAPLYWIRKGNSWMEYTLQGIRPLDLKDAVKHISFYEAEAFTAWKGYRLPTEFEWEAACSQIPYGHLWEWTHSAYLPYPDFQKAKGGIGEYNGKFMINQMVLRGGSLASPENHIRPTYRNFFHPDKRWQYTGIRLCKK